MKTLTDLRKLRNVVAVAKAGNITSAATSLNMTQSALTKSVAEVEHLLGMKLFERLPRGVRLTDAGTAFVPRAERILADANELMAELGQLQSLAAGHLRIGVAPAAFTTFLEDAVGRFAGSYPGVNIAITDGPIDTMVNALNGGQVDLLVGSSNYLSAWPELQVQPLQALQHFFIGRLHHPASQLTSLDAAQLLTYPLVMPAAGITDDQQVIRAYQSAGLPPRAPKYICDHFPLVGQIVSATDAISPVVSATRPGRRMREAFHVFEDIIQMDTQVLGVATLNRRAGSPATNAFVQMLRAEARVG